MYWNDLSDKDILDILILIYRKYKNSSIVDLRVFGLVSLNFHMIFILLFDYERLYILTSIDQNMKMNCKNVINMMLDDTEVEALSIDFIISKVFLYPPENPNKSIFIMSINSIFYSKYIYFYILKIMNDINIEDNQVYDNKSEIIQLIDVINRNINTIRKIQSYINKNLIKNNKFILKLLSEEPILRKSSLFKAYNKYFKNENDVINKKMSSIGKINRESKKIMINKQNSIRKINEEDKFYFDSNENNGSDEDLSKSESEQSSSSLEINPEGGDRSKKVNKEDSLFYHYTNQILLKKVLSENEYVLFYNILNDCNMKCPNLFSYLYYSFPDLNSLFNNKCENSRYVKILFEERVFIRKVYKIKKKIRMDNINY